MSIVGVPDFGEIEPLAMDRASIGRHMLGKDTTGVTYTTLSFMDRVEDWVLERLAHESEAKRVEVEGSLRQLGAIVARYRDKMPCDNFMFLQITGWLNTSVVVYVLDYLTECQPDFLTQLIEFCDAIEDENINAALMMKRMRALLRTRLLDRIYSPENTEYVMRILLRSAM